MDTISRMVCECGLTPTLSMSKSDKDYGKMYLRCPQRNCDLFQWWRIIVTDVCWGKHVLAGKFELKSSTHTRTQLKLLCRIKLLETTHIGANAFASSYPGSPSPLTPLSLSPLLPPHS